MSPEYTRQGSRARAKEIADDSAVSPTELRLYVQILNQSSNIKRGVCTSKLALRFRTLIFNLPENTEINGIQNALNGRKPYRALIVEGLMELIADEIPLSQRVAISNAITWVDRLPYPPIDTNTIGEFQEFLKKRHLRRKTGKLARARVRESFVMISFLPIREDLV